MIPQHSIYCFTLMMILVRSGSKHHLRTSLSVSSSSEAAKTAGAAAVNTNGPSPPIQTSSNKNNQASVSPSSSGFSSIGNSSCSSGSGSPPGNSFFFFLSNFQGFEPEKLWSTSNYRFCIYFEIVILSVCVFFFDHKLVHSWSIIKTWKSVLYVVLLVKFIQKADYYSTQSSRKYFFFLIA